MALNGLNALLAAATGAPAATTSTATPAGATGSPSPPTPGLLGNPLILLVLVGVMFYFLMIRPQSQQRKRQAQLMENLKSGDRVVTSSGIVGVVVTVKDKTVSLRSADAKMEMTKSSVVDILERSGEDKSAS